MEIKKLIDKYSFHDSVINSIFIDESNNKIIIDLDLCNYMQPEYHEGDTEIVKAALIFSDIKHWETPNFNLRNFDWKKNVSGGILKVSLMDGPIKGIKLFIELTDYEQKEESYFSLLIQTDEAELKRGEEYP